MRRSTKPLSISSLIRREAKTDPKPPYQRGPVWTTKQKQLLIDTILNDLDIPKLYLRVLEEGTYDYEVVDGQQRLRTIWEFAKGEYRTAKDADPLENGQDIANLKYADLPEDLKDVFNDYSLDIVELHEATLDDVEEMFLRLQNGSTLKAAEKRNALPGNMKYFIREVAEHPFFQKCGFKNKRFLYDQVASQMMTLELEGDIRNIKSADLNKMYLENQDFDKGSVEAKKILKVLNFLNEAFPEKTPELERYNAISLYVLASILVEKYATAGLAEKFGKWFVSFETKRRAELDLPEDQRDSELLSYQNATSHSTDAVESLAYRHKVLARSFFMDQPEIKTLDGHRGFTREQKLAIFRRDNGVCQLCKKCDCKRLGWEDDWHADHVLPHSKGGETTVRNGQVACAECNLAKGAQDN